MVRLSGWVKGLLLFLVVILAIRMALPYAAQWYINRVLSQPGGYQGRVGDVDLMLWKGSYSLDEIILIQEGGSTERPLFKADSVKFSLLWSAVIKGAVVGNVTLVRPEINFIDSQNDSKDQTGESENWLNLADQLFPLQIDKFEIIDGQIKFHNPDSTPPIDVALHDINGAAYNLVNSRDLSKDLVARAQFEAQTAEQGTLSFKSQLNPSTKKPTFDVDIQAKNIALVNFKNVLDTYAPFDLEAGTLELAAELASDDGHLQGYIKPILHNVTVFSWKDDIVEDDDGFFEGIIEAGSALILEIFENQSEDQIATRVSLEGDLDSPDTPILPALGAIIENAFINAINGQVEGSVDLQDATDEKEQAEAQEEADNKPE
ncbi:DUF748 domain-containing protein [Alteromonas lipotrueiana]|uniref:DUF748 domain-containing protein n=1 Tax=Alteromonas lipotrueiana TaxID=2803815 RepID=UPI001C43C226|nr:DUF748 domain-containing protein [Alteromonas lipotrueiana]